MFITKAWNVSECFLILLIAKEWTNSAVNSLGVYIQIAAHLYKQTVLYLGHCFYKYLCSCFPSLHKELILFHTWKSSFFVLNDVNKTRNSDLCGLSNGNSHISGKWSQISITKSSSRWPCSKHGNFSKQFHSVYSRVDLKQENFTILKPL